MGFPPPIPLFVAVGVVVAVLVAVAVVVGVAVGVTVGVMVGVLVGVVVIVGVAVTVGVAVAHKQLELVRQSGFLQTPVNEPIDLEHIKFDGQSIFLTHELLQPDRGVGVAHHPSVGSFIIQGGFRSRHAGLGIQFTLDALFLTSNLTFIIDQTKSGKAINKANVMPKASWFFVFEGNDFNPLNICIYP